MLFRRDVLERIARGEVTLAFRRWKPPTVKPCGRLRTPAGVLRIGAVDRIGADDLTDRDARAAGYHDSRSTLKALGNEDGRALWRIELGLTESLDIGYRLSPRGAGVLKRLAGTL